MEGNGNGKVDIDIEPRLSITRVALDAVEAVGLIVGFMFAAIVFIILAIWAVMSLVEWLF